MHLRVFYQLWLHYDLDYFLFGRFVLAKLIVLKFEQCGLAKVWQMFGRISCLSLCHFVLLFNKKFNKILDFLEN